MRPGGTYHMIKPYSQAFLLRIIRRQASSIALVTKTPAQSNAILSSPVAALLPLPLPFSLLPLFPLLSPPSLSSPLFSDPTTVKSASAFPSSKSAVISCLPLVSFCRYSDFRLTLTLPDSIVEECFCLPKHLRLSSDILFSLKVPVRPS